MSKDHFPEAVENGAGWRRIELLGLEERLAAPDSRREAFASLDIEGMAKVVDYVHSVATQTERIDGYQDGKLPMLETPPAEDKEELMHSAFTAVQNILTSEELDDQTALRRAGLTLAGAINYIHPFNDGNGRTGRIMHYLTEFGTERGKDVFESELYAIMAKGYISPGDNRVALYDTPPAELERALNKVVTQSTDADMPREQYPTLRILAFLDMMSGKTTVPIGEKSRIITGSALDGTKKIVNYGPNEIDGLTLYDKQSFAASTISFMGPRSPQDRNIVEQPESSYINLDMTPV